MRLSRRTVLLLVAGVVLVIAAAALVWSRLPGSPLREAVDRLPAETRRASFTDWRAVREAVSGQGSGPGSTERFLRRAFDEDLTSASALTSSVEALDEAFGVTPMDAEWEVYGQAPDGSVDILKLRADVDLDGIEERLAELGYEPPADGAGPGGVWAGTADLVASLALTPLQENVAVVRSARLLMTSDAPEFLSAAVRVARGDGDSLASVDGVSDLVAAAEEPGVALLWAGDFACEDLAMSQAGPEDAAEATTLVEAAGGVHPLSGLVMAQRVGGPVVVGMWFADADQASDDLQPRADLATGPAPGQGGSFADRFEVTDAVADGRRVVLTLDPREPRVLSDLSQGPVLFATC